MDPRKYIKKKLMGKSIHVRSIFLFFFRLVVSTQKDSPCNFPLKPGRDSSPFAVWNEIRSQLWDGQSGDFHWANAFSSGGMDLSPFSRQACGGKLSLGESMVFRSANKRLFLWLLKDRKTSMLVRVGVSPRCVLFFSLLLMCLDIYISYTVSVIYILYKITYLLCLCMNYLSNCWFALIYSTCWWVWSYSTWSWVFMMCVNLSTSWWVLIDFWP